MRFSLIVPTWNNLEYLKVFVFSVRKYSHFDHEIILHINEGTDGTKEWADDNGIKYTYSVKNLGVCKAFNSALSICSNDFVVYFNDDMFALPGWDTELARFYQEHREVLGEDMWLSGTMIEHSGYNDCCIAPYDYGKTIARFREADLLADLEWLRGIKGNVNGSTWPPTMFLKSKLLAVGGFDEDYFPGFGSDPDIAKKYWDAGVRHFIGVGSSLVYHFGSKTTKRVRNDYSGRKIFQKKHGMTIDHFVRNVIKRGTRFGD